MEEFLIPIPALALLCFGITVACASVGLGGGTAYMALLAIFGAGHQMIPTVSLLLIVVVTTIGSLILLQARHGRAALIVPFVITSVPAAYNRGIASRVLRVLLQPPVGHAAPGGRAHFRLGRGGPRPGPRPVR